MDKIYFGECPYIQRSHSICVKYAYVPMTGTLSLNYKKSGLNCSYSNECPDINNCPIYQKAPKSITE